jgi:hypothetical protein
MAEYKLSNMTTIVRSDGAHIPSDERNQDYREYLSWIAEGNTPDPADPAPARSTTLSPSQQIILANGEDAALVNITGEPGALIDYTINGDAQSITLDESGTDALELTCDTPNTTLLVQSGNARAVIFAVEVPS